MIKTEFSRCEGDWLRLRIDGHAGYGEEGNDIVCAAVSGIFYSLCGYLSNFCSDEVRLDYVGSGHAEVRCSAVGEEAMKLACIGIWQISLTYPECVNVENNAWNWKMNSCRA
ncbi:MAG: ribosomal-processing cysteine protease Prp [Clostridia bacterium]|nr:ribosomal-processing cysteine protease Prp [Clostridia bacterium]